ncbi:MAG: hypothetical protein SVM86_00160 [Candidatus Cloacimonadota bacterium]|nr:hypothetical protein [Candidatus Cloacimonadota bacterium]
MKKILFIMLILSMNISIWAYFDNFSENPASIAQRNHIEFYFPGLAHNISLYNSLVSLSDLSMFEAEHNLTNSEKQTLTKDDLNMNFYMNYKPLSFGYNNWNLSTSVYAKIDAKMLEKKYTELVFYGNEDDHYVSNSGEGSHGYGFVKIQATYAYDKPLRMNFIPESKTSSTIWNETVNYVRTMPIYFGANLNLYNSLAYGKVTSSSQRFGTCEDSTYYEYNINYEYSDEDTHLNTNLGLGLGFTAKLPEGWFHFSLDDIFAKLNYEDLAGAEYTGAYVDSLLYFDEDYEPFDESYENDSLRVDKREVRLKLTFVCGVKHNLYKKVNGFFKYTSSDYIWEGVELGIFLNPVPWLPLQISTGFAEDVRWNFAWGIDLKNFAYTTKLTYMNGLIAKSRGLGISSGIKFKF